MATRGSRPSGFSLKDSLLGPDRIRYLSGRFAGAPGFDRKRFERAVTRRLPELGLKERIGWIAECLLEELPSDLPSAAPILRAALPEPLDPNLTDGDYGDFVLAPLGDVVLALGLEDEPGLALDLLGEITMRFSMEWSMRPMLERWPDLAMSRLAEWAGHENYHVRRLVSEATRPRLPWGQGISLSHEAPLPLLDRLHADSTRYVTRSVANHLNDVSKVDPGLVLDRLENWRDLREQNRRELDWMAGHALRGLVKAGNPEALEFLGFDPAAPIRLVGLDVPRKGRIGGALEFAATLEARRECGAVVDFALWRPTARGKPTRKVYKLKRARLEARVPMRLAKRHELPSDATTYKLLPGKYRLELLVNGRILGEAEVALA